MKLKKLFNIMVVIGIVIFIGAVGTMDYKVTVGEYYPLKYTVMTMISGMAMCVPFFVSEVL